MEVQVLMLQQIIGRAGYGKSSICLEEVRKQLKEQTIGSPIIYIVPEQMTFQTEYALVSTPEIKGMIRAQVFSFTRLAWKILQEVGGSARQHLDSVGIRMMLRKLTERHKREFVIYGKAAEQTGFIEQLEAMLVEYKRHCVTPDKLQATQELLDKQLNSKIHDIHQIYADFETELATKYVDSEDYLNLLTEKIATSTYISHAQIYIDGFHSFTPQELLVIEACLKYAEKVTITHTLDKPYDYELPNQMHLFHSSAKTYQRIREIATKSGTTILPTIILEAPASKRIAPALAHLEQRYHRRPIKPFDGETETNIAIVTAVNRRAEVEGLARQIIHKTRDEGYRYRQLAIIVRNIQDYQDLIETVFRDYQIPVFFDQKKSMLHHPLIELIRSSVDVITHNWHYEAVFRCVKTDLLLGSEREALDRLENYVLANGIQGYRWTSTNDWKYQSKSSLEADLQQTTSDQAIEQEINQLRWQIATPLAKLQAQVQAAKTGRMLAEAIYNFLVELQVPEQLLQWEQQAESQGDLIQARQHQQAWQAVIQLLDQVVEIIGEDNVSVELFSKIIDSGLENMHFSLVPPAFDQVVVATLDFSRVMDIRCSFLVGINEGVVPAKVKEDGMLTEEERDMLQAVGVQLAPSFKSKLMEEPFIIYNALASATDYLWVSYSLADLEGKSLLPSTLIGQLQGMFPRAKQALLVVDPNEVEADEQLQYITNPSQTISYLINQLRHWKRGYPIRELWWDVYNWYAESSNTNNSVVENSVLENRDVTNSLTGIDITNKWSKAISSLFYVNKEYKLKPKTSEQLYGTKLKASVSRLELYKSCPFSHFAAYGLKLQERVMHRLQAPDIGQLFHAALKLIADDLEKKGKHWGEVTHDEYQQLAQATVEELAPKVQHEILLSSKRHRYILRKLQDVITRTSIVLGKQAKASAFTPIRMELGFGDNGELPSLMLKLPNGAEMELRGRIDRVDQAIFEDQLLLRVIDYKSSQTMLGLSELYDGLSLQMLTYLDVVITFAEHLLGKKALPAGALYFHVHNPMLKFNEGIAELSSELLEQQLFKEYKLRGFILANQEIVQLMDTNLAGGSSVRSDIVPAGLKKDGSFYAFSTVVSDSQFDILREHVRKVISDIGTQIIDGIIDIQPYRLKLKTACTFCKYKALCQFDQGLNENKYRAIPTIKKLDELFGKIGGAAND